MKSKKLPKDIKAAVYMRIGRAEQLLDAVTEFIEKENKMSDKITFKFTDEQVRVLREALLSYNNPDKNKISNELFEHLGNRLRDYTARKER
jgi:dsRNA-specific ribonuclease